MTAMKKLFPVLLLLNSYSPLHAQSVGINTDGSAPHPSAILDIKSNTKGILIPRTSTFSRLGMVNPANGLMLYDTTIGSFWFQNGGVWIESGRIDVVNSNAFFGYQSGRNIPVGDFNSGFGTEALFSNTTGNGNTSLGLSSMHTNTTGNNNTSAGMFTLFFNTTGSSNTAIGNNAMLFNQTGHSNVAVGLGALFHNTAGSNVVAIGDSALFNSDNSSINTAVGSKALFTNSSGYSNTAIGHFALYGNITGILNTAIGDGAMRFNTTGQGNTAIGTRSLENNSGNYNVAIGDESMLLSDGAGYDNTSIGASSYTEGSNNTALGNSSAVTGTDNAFSTALGAFAFTNCSNCLVLGGHNQFTRTKVGINVLAPLTDLHIVQQTDNTLDNTRGIRLQRPNGNQWRVFLDPSSNYIFQYNNSLYSYIEPAGGAFVNPSDERLKKDILPLDDALNKVLQLQPKTYHYISSADTDRRLYGFLAQDVEKIFPEFVFTSETGYKGIAYSNFSVVAIKAIQQQQGVITELKDKNQQLEQQMEALLKRIETLEKK
jgi:Chaperone of endosialidase